MRQAGGKVACIIVNDYYSHMLLMIYLSIPIFFHGSSILNLDLFFRYQLTRYGGNNKSSRLISNCLISLEEWELQIIISFIFLLFYDNSFIFFEFSANRSNSVWSRIFIASSLKALGGASLHLRFYLQEVRKIKIAKTNLKLIEVERKSVTK